MQFTYEISPFIAKVYPTNGPINGGTRIVVSGENMRSSDKLSCQLGDKVVKAKYISSGAIECNTPPSAKPGILLRVVTTAIILVVARSNFHITLGCC